jgi:hypothetical protein
MATQDFLSGGFYGKLGDVVGQRWHNKRYIRSYVKGTNPNTPAQQSNRGMFGKATKLAQLAFNINKGDNSWETTAKGEFSLRVGTAMNRLKAGMSDTDALPLYPDGFNPSHTLSSPSFAYYSSTQTYRIFSNDTFNVQGRTFGIVIHCFNVFSDKWEDIEYSYYDGSTVQFDFSWTSDNIHAFPPGSTFTAATTDDSTHANASILFPSFAFQQTVKPTLANTITWGTFSEEIDWLDFNPIPARTILGPEKEFIAELHIYSLYDSEWKTTDFSIITRPDGQIWAGVELGSENQARNGTYILAGNDTIELDEAYINLSWPYKAFTWP